MPDQLDSSMAMGSSAWARAALTCGTVAVAAIVVACEPSPTHDDVALLLRSSNAESVYDAGVGAYRAKHFADARRLWHHAAELGDHEAQSNLGFLLYYGYGGSPDSVLGAEYWRRAMIANDAEAHRHVAQAILDGNTRLGSALDAYSHAVAANTIASLPGQLEGDDVSRDAKKLMDNLRTSLSASEIESATQLGMKWAAPHGYP